jgi:hypothetical protein
VPYIGVSQIADRGSTDRRSTAQTEEAHAINAQPTPRTLIRSITCLPFLTAWNCTTAALTPTAPASTSSATCEAWAAASQHATDGHLIEAPCVSDP